MEYIIDERYDGVRLDRFLRKTFPDTPLTEIFKALRVGNIKVNGKKSKENTRIVKGDIIKIFKLYGVEVAERSECKIREKVLEKNNFMKLSEKQEKEVKNVIVYEDEKVVIINKPAGVVMHAGSGHETGLVEMVAAYYKNSDFSFVNRIDKGTSGLVIGAKTLPVARELSEEIRENRMDKKYYILVQGRVKEKTFKIVSFLKKVEDRVIEVKSSDPGAKESTSYFQTVSVGEKTSLLIGTLDSGRTHQLRVQLSNKGNAIVGDARYLTKIPYKRMMLHSYYLEIPKYNIKIELPLPKEFQPF